MSLTSITTQDNPEAMPFLIAAAVATAIATLAWHRRSVPGGPALFTMMSGEAGWALCGAAELLIVDPPIKRFWFSLKAGAAVAGDSRSDDLRPALYRAPALAE